MKIAFSLSPLVGLAPRPCEALFSASKLQPIAELGESPPDFDPVKLVGLCLLDA